MSIGIAEEAVNEVTEQVTEAVQQAGGRLKLDIGGNLLDAVLGYLVVFIGLGLLMAVIILVGKVMTAKAKKPAETAAAPAPVAAPEVKALPAAPGTAGQQVRFA